MEFPGGNDSYLTITGSGHPFLAGTETFHTPSLGDEEFEIPPISLDADPSLAVSDVVGHFDLGDPSGVQDGGFAAQYGVQTLDMPVEMTHEVMEQAGGLLGAGLAMDLDQTIVTPYSANPPVTIDVSMADMSSGLLAHNQLTTIDQSELSSQLGLSLGGGTILPPVQSPEDHLSPTPSPTSSLHDEDMEDFRRITAPKTIVVEQTKKQKTPKKKKKKDPNEPQKPLSAYALFFRDTQAAIKGQNPNATFGEVSKIVASMWDSLGEEQKQVYKRKTEAAKKDYLKALALYKANQLSQVVVDASDLDPPPATPKVLPESPVHSPTVVTAPSIPQRVSPPPDPIPPPQTAPPLQPSITKIIISKQMLQAGQIPTSIAMSQGMVTVIPATMVTSRGIPLHQLQPSPQAQRVTRSVLQAMQLPPRLQPPPLQQMQQPPRLQQMPSAQQPSITILQAPPPLQPMQKVRLSLHQPPPLQINFIPPPLQPQPQAVQVQSQSVPIISVSPSPEIPTSPPEQLELLTEVVQEESSPPPMDVELVSGSPPRSPSPQPRCVRSGCENPPVESKDWDNEYCSNECVAKHCRDTFLAWVAARNPGTLASVK
ncbi:TOX high mobility group box family member 4 isoform X2 [Bombina bombina]|uniref:TOX high mobility group box family member 4 isoform X2 n=1 Tax=Bombina bombina TaxID=8345 RepID=UPI00235AADFF|nr:TOX high mobility group box family member 4 isoform X2 [Bombina bombina]